MAQTAKIGLAQAQFGALPAGGGCIREPRLIGVSAAKRLIMLGKLVGAEDALRIGLVDEICAPEQLMARAFALAA
jgi:enoyl-CoA hydratase/carnithine racemase